MMQADEREVADRLDGVEHPAERVSVVGHQSATAEFCRAYRSGRMHHAWLITGPRGIGKATLAFRLATHLLLNPEPVAAPQELSASSSDNPVNRQIANGSHPNVLHLTRPWDEKAKRFKTRLSVEEIRRTQHFYSMTAGAGGWRITIVDPADEMNASAANALLKILEEPPGRSVFFVLSHSPGGLLPTIRSRCRTLQLSPLSTDEVVRVLADSGVGGEKAHAAAALCEGSVRRAFTLAGGDTLAQFRKFEEIANRYSEKRHLDWPSIHRLADTLARRGQEEAFGLFHDMVLGWIARQVRTGNGARGELAGWASVWEKASHSFAVADTFNLDRKQVILSLFQMIFDREPRYR